ncbi:transcription elongation factor spt4 [Vairimorpha apis BRL 01]|uniref:Transcription elongation factor SPT4 n=1 Tax=Vairimorpha apis BRL 01 TaxID=1037528 RepID=T0L673_9MICR|nr:transcription elongation factor spt4 [Vairimorpha apis BRL 01]
MSFEFPLSFSTKLKCCKLCSKISSQLKSKGCDNCTTVSKDSNIVSNKFKGMIGLVEPDKSWVAKWQRINGLKKGLYALTVAGDVDEEVIVEYEKSGRVYLNRKESFKLE